jgi:hypothetical protein
MNTRATAFSARYASIWRELKTLISISTTKGTYKDTSQGKPRLPSTFLPCWRQCRVITALIASQGKARFKRSSGWVGETAIWTR